VNKKATYETIITDKLTNMPIPDMVDAIWTNISMQLDADAPIEKQEKEPQQIKPKQKLRLSKIIKPFIAVTAIVIIVVFLIVKNKRKKTQQQKQVVPENIKRDSVVINKNEPPNIAPILKVEPKKDSAYQKPIDKIFQNKVAKDTVIKKDSTALFPLQPKTNDSIVKTIIPNNIEPINDQGSKKPRGVKGITDDDYKIKGYKKDTIK
jgi:hypothetical protein